MFKLDEFMGRRVLKSSLIDDKDIVAFFTTRDLPLKSGERDDLIEEVEQNKKLISIGLDIPQGNLIIPIQTHSDNLEIIHSPIHLFTHSPFKNTDALITDQPNIALGLNFADCVPIIFYDPIKRVVASAHAGWRGTVAKIGPKTVEKMVNEFGSKPEDIVALIGPAIGKCCFEAGEDVLLKLQNSLHPHPYPLSPQGRGENAMPFESFKDAISGMHADLKQINKIQLLANGLKKIDVCEYCTSCQSELFFSYRKEKGKTARHSAVTMIKSER